MTDPWTALSERPDLLLLRLPIAERGRYYHHLHAIVVRCGLQIVEERATLWHELVHAARGDHEACDDRQHRRRELACHREAARASIEIQDLAAALVWSQNVDEVADELKTTVEYVQIRLSCLHPSERGYLKRRLAVKEQTA